MGSTRVGFANLPSRGKTAPDVDSISLIDESYTRYLAGIVRQTRRTEEYRLLSLPSVSRVSTNDPEMNRWMIIHYSERQNVDCSDERSTPIYMSTFIYTQISRVIRQLVKLARQVDTARTTKGPPFARISGKLSPFPPDRARAAKDASRKISHYRFNIHRRCESFVE